MTESVHSPSRSKQSHPRGSFRQLDSPAAWQHAVDKLPAVHVLQSQTWGEFKARWGWSSHYYVMTIPADRAAPQAAALVLSRKLPKLPLSVLYVPKGPVLDFRDAALRRVVLAELEQIARNAGAIFIKIDPEVVQGWGLDADRTSAVGAKFIQELSQRGWRESAEQVQFRNTVELSLQRPEEELLEAMKQKTRYNIRLASRKGILVRPGTAEDFGTIAQMYLETARRDGFAVRPQAYYMDIWQSFWDAGLAQPFLAEYQGRPVAAIILVISGDRVIYMYGASSNEERQRMPNYLLQWEGIRWARSRGFQTYDFWGAPDEFVESDQLWSVWRFKSGFDGQVVRHIGAWDYPVRPTWYWVYTVLIPRYLDMLRSRAAGTPGITRG